MKVILNKCYGGFDVSYEGYQLYVKKKGLQLYTYEANVSDFDVLERVEQSRRSLSTRYFTKDFGQTVRRDSLTIDDWEYSLRLGEDYRTDPVLIEVVEELGEKASGAFGQLEIVEIPDDMSYEITDYDGIEILHESHRQW